MFIEKIAESKFFHRICESTRGALCRFPLAMLLFFWMSLISFDGAIGLDIVAENWRRALVFYFLLAGTLAAIVQLAAEMWHLSVLRRELVQAFSQLLFFGGLLAACAIYPPGVGAVYCVFFAFVFCSGIATGHK